MPGGERDIGETMKDANYLLTVPQLVVPQALCQPEEEISMIVDIDTSLLNLQTPKSNAGRGCGS